MMNTTRHLSKDGSVHVTDEVVATSLHMAAAVFSLFGGTLLILKAVALGSPLAITSAAVYSAPPAIS